MNKRLLAGLIGMLVLSVGSIWGWETWETNTTTRSPHTLRLYTNGLLQTEIAKFHEDTTIVTNVTEKTNARGCSTCKMLQDNPALCLYHPYHVRKTEMDRIERHWAETCGNHKVPPVIARWVYWDRKQGQLDSRYWSYVFEENYHERLSRYA